MNKDVGTLIRLLRCSLSLENDFYDDKVDWFQMFELACRNDLVALLFPVIKNMELQHQIPSELFDIWKKYSMHCAIYEQHKHYALRKLLKRARIEHVDFILIKGFVLADLYPQYQQRTSCDTDLYIEQSQKEKAAQLLNELGYRLSEKSKDAVGVFVNETYKHTIELHTCLWEDYAGPKMKLLEELHITDAKSFIELNVCGINVKSLGYTQHLIFQLFHMIKHFSLESGSIRYWIDITLYVNRYFENLQLDLLWYGLKKMGYDVFCLAIFRLCIKHFGMNSHITTSNRRFREDKLDILLNEFVTNSRLFKEEKEKWELMGEMIPYFVGEKQEYDKEVKITMRLFPTQERLLDKYYLGRKYKLLLPLSWIHRIIDLIISERKAQNGEYTAYERALAVNHKLKVMKNFGLLNEENNNA